MKVISHRLPWVWISDSLLQLAYCANPCCLGHKGHHQKGGCSKGGGSGGGVGDEASSTLRAENVGTSTLTKVVTMRLPDTGGGEG